MTLMLPRQVGSVRVRERLGEGGMAFVHRGEDPYRPDRPLAVKLLRPEAARDAELVQRFLREGQLLKALRHPHLVEVQDFGRSGSTPYLVMELLPGGSVKACLGEPPATLVRRLLGPMEGLHVAHEAGVVHRDLKPSNLLFAADGRLKVTDFGVCLWEGAEATRVTRSRMVVGTVGYMAPEQHGDPRRVDRRADVYALGAILLGSVGCGDDSGKNQVTDGGAKDGKLDGVPAMDGSFGGNAKFDAQAGGTTAKPGGTTAAAGNTGTAGALSAGGTVTGGAVTGGVIVGGTVVGGAVTGGATASTVRDGGVDRPKTDGSSDVAVDAAVDRAIAPVEAGPDTPNNCGDPNEPCCTNNTCNAGGCCMQTGGGGGGRRCIASGSNCSGSNGVCQAGACVSDAGACGGEGDRCCSNNTCTASGVVCAATDGGSLCLSCGGAGEPCCGTGGNRTCGTGLACSGTGLNARCEPCGGTGQVCCSGNACSVAGNACGPTAGGGEDTCQVCGKKDGPCCANNTCTDTGTICASAGFGQDNTCQACGGAGEDCCANRACTGGGCCGSNNECIGADEACPSNLGGGVCIAGACTRDAGACGGKDDPCCGLNNICTSAGLVCATTDGGESCQECGDVDQPCCRNSGTFGTRTCNTANLLCEASGGLDPIYTCRACGQRNQVCCGSGPLAGRICADGLTCRANDAPSGGGIIGTCQ